MLTKNSVQTYHYGFNGKTNDNEAYSVEGSFQDYGMRMYDTRLARFISVDPITKQYPELTPYQFASNNPIALIDLDGLEGKNPLITGGPALTQGCIEVLKTTKKALVAMVNIVLDPISDANNAGMAKGARKTELTKSANNGFINLAVNVAMGYGLSQFVELGIVAKGLFTETKIGLSLTQAGKGIGEIFSKNSYYVKSFKDGKFSMAEATEDMTVYRVWGGKSKETGGYFTLTKPTSSKQAETLLNVYQYGNTATEVTPYTIKKGSQFAIGEVQGGTGNQIIIPEAVQNAGGNKVIKAGAATKL